MPRIVSQTLRWLFAVGLTLAGLEVALRVVPTAIPLRLLTRYQPDLRLEIAQRRGLPNRSQVRELPRTDGGPKLTLFRPFARVNYSYRDPEKVDVMQLDENGFCNALGTGIYDAAKIDIVTVGDSFTWCQALAPEDTWTGQLAALVARPAYNLGRGGVGLYEYLQILEKFGLPKSPDIVVMNIYEGNDVRDAVRYWDHAKRSRRGNAAQPRKTQRGAAAGVLGRHSYGFNLLASGAVAAGGRAADLVQRLTEPEIDMRYRVRFPDGDLDFNPWNWDRDELEHARAVVSGEIQLGIFDAALSRFTGLAREHDFVPVVSYTPTAYTAYADRVVFSDSGAAASLAAYSRAQRAYFSRSADELGFHLVDATPALQAAAARYDSQNLLYFPTNAHYTTAGHRVLAEEIAKALRSIGQQRL